MLRIFLPVLPNPANLRWKRIRFTLGLLTIGGTCAVVMGAGVLTKAAYDVADDMNPPAESSESSGASSGGDNAGGNDGGDSAGGNDGGNDGGDSAGGDFWDSALAPKAVIKGQIDRAGDKAIAGDCSDLARLWELHSHGVPNRSSGDGLSSEELTAEVLRYIENLGTLGSCGDLEKLAED